MSETSVKTYEIGGKKYEQRELVLAECRLFRRELQGLELPAATDVMGWVKEVVAALEESDRLDRVLAILLTEQGGSRRDKDLAALAAELVATITPQQIARVITDFFVCNPVNSILDLLTGILESLSAVLNLTARQTLSRRLSSSLPTGTSPVATPSSGE